MKYGSTVFRPAVLLLALASFGIGCGDGGSDQASASATGSTTTPGGGTTTTPPPPAPAPPRWWKGDLHVHTDHSYGAVDTVGQTREMSLFAGLDFVVLSDHDVLTQAQDPEFYSTPDLEMILGCEWTDMAHGGVINPLSLPAKIDRTQPINTFTQQAQTVIDRAHNEGAAFVLYHPAWRGAPWGLPVQRFDAIEIWNTNWMLGDIGIQPTDPQKLQSWLDQLGPGAGTALPVSPEIVAAAGLQSGNGNDRALHFWESHLNQGRRVGAVGGSDRHDSLLPGYPCTWVLSPTRTADGITAGIRAGRTMVTQGPEGPFVTFEADANGDGVFEAIVGDTIPSGQNVRFRVRVEGAKDGLVHLVQGRQRPLNQNIPSDDATFFVDVQPQAGEWFRVDVFHKIDFTLAFASQATSLLQGATPNQLTSLVSLWVISVVVGANQPIYTFAEGYRLLPNIAPSKITHSRAAIT
ncbi:MAG: CehA/McbA family metallohydrolase domain-containing protein, partial [Planctomycetota bacterium]